MVLTAGNELLKPCSDRITTIDHKSHHNFIYRSANILRILQKSDLGYKKQMKTHKNQ